VNARTGFQMRKNIPSIKPQQRNNKAIKITEYLYFAVLEYFINIGIINSY
jgi:hypothetical protein